MNPERTLPHSLEAERAVLGAVLLHQELISEAEDAVRPEDFYRPGHAVLFRHMLKLSATGTVIDFVTLRDALGAEIEAIGGAGYLASLIDGVPRSSSLMHHAKIVREKSDLRALIFSASRMAEQAYAASDDVAEILAAAEQQIIGLADRTISSGFEAMRAIASRGLDFIDEAHKLKSAVSGVPSGLTELDEMTRGFNQGKLITIGARPGVGKSSLLGNNIAQFAALAGYKVGVFSLEMDKNEIFCRHLSAVAHIDGHRLQTGYLGDRDWARISAAVGELSEAPLYIDDTPAVSLLEVRSRARRLKAEHGLDILLIDYLQLMSTPNVKGSNRSQEIGAITAALKALAKELRIPIVIASQLNRDMVTANRRPRLSDLKESGSIEQDSDIVLLLHRDEENPDQPTECIIAKNRGGAIGTVKLKWIDTETRYETFNPSGAPSDQSLPMVPR